MAMALRVRIRVELESLRAILDPNPMTRSDYNENPVPKLRESVEILKLLFTQSYLLEAEEYDALGILLAQMMIVSRSDTIDSTRKNHIFTVLSLALSTLKKFKSFRSKYQGLKPPELEKET